MNITREEARQIFMAGAMWEQKATDYNFENLWKNIQPKLKSMESPFDVVNCKGKHPEETLSYTDEGQMHCGKCGNTL